MQASNNKGKNNNNRDNKFTVSEEFDGVTLIKWFRKNDVGMPHGLIQKLVRKKSILVNDKKVRQDKVLQVGDIITLPSKLKKEEKKSKAPVKKYIPTEEDAEKYLISNIIFMDKRIIALNKPQGLATQGGSGVVLSVDDMLKYLKFENDHAPMLAHRLDKDTTGLLLLARTREAAAILGFGFKEKIIVKKYLALVAGVPEQRKGRIAYPLGPRRGAGGAEKMAVDYETGKIAVTEYRVIKEFDNGAASLLEVSPKTGRKHQIRAHLNEIGHPIIGDGKYGGAASFIDGFGKNLHLHAWKISHKENYFEDEIEAEVPEYFCL